MSYSAYVEKLYYKDKEIALDLLSELGNNVTFDDDIWLCDKLRRGPYQKKRELSLYFNSLPHIYKDKVKYFIISRLKQNRYLTTVQLNIAHLVVFLNFISDQYNDIDLASINNDVICEFKYYLDNSSYKKSAYYIWVTNKIFFDALIDWKDFSLKNPFLDNPYYTVRKHNYKLIPEEIEKQLDKIFKSNEIPLYMKTIYWIIRLIPSRINEVCAMSIDCLKVLNNRYILFLPTWKQNGGYGEAQIRRIYLEYEGMSKYLIDLIREQQEVSGGLQKYVEDKGVLFTYIVHMFNGNKFKKDGIREFVSTKNVKIMNGGGVNRFLLKICNIYDVRDKEGNIYTSTSHQFRHNGITDRLMEGFTPEQIQDMTAHHGDSMIFGAYNHLNLRPEVIHEKQEKVIERLYDSESSPIYYRGRILNMEDEVEKKLLRNARAHRIRGGICSDITNCKCDMFYCLDCNYFIPDAEQVDYFRDQSSAWHEKMKIFKPYPTMFENAKYNYDLYMRIIDLIESKVKGNE